MNKQKQDPEHRVVFYEGYKLKESPRAIIIGNREIKIQKIISRKRVKDKKSGKILEVFRCRVADRHAKITIHGSGRAEVFFESE